MTLDHPDYQAMLAAVLADPADDMPRLILADWLDEHAGEVECGRCDGAGRERYADAAGDMDDRECPDCGGMFNKQDGSGRVPNGFAEYAEFIRVQCQIAALEAAVVEKRKDAAMGGCCNRFADNMACDCPSGPEIDAMRKRERELLESHGDRWAKDAMGDLYRPFLHGGGRAVFRRGFVDEIRCPLRLWVGEPCPGCIEPGELDDGDPRCRLCHGLGTVGGIGPEMVRRCPLTKVTLTDRGPLNQTDGCWTWWADERDVHLDHASRLPWRLFLLLKGGERLAPSEKSWERGSRLFNQIYPTRQAALDALSAACLGWAKSGAVGVPSHG